MKILVTGSSGFIGSGVVLKLLKLGHKVIGIDNHNNYYNPKLKRARLNLFKTHKNFVSYDKDIQNISSINKIFRKHRPNKVIHLAAQAGVQYSIKNPLSYVENNILGFTNILENCRSLKVKHLVYASSSSVYGANKLLPFSTNHNVDHPISFYAATKKANELMAHTYSHLFQLPTTGLRFFTVYGPWGRPDMSLFKFANLIMKNKPINIYNNGNHQRDFTYIDDIVEGVLRVLEKPPKPNPNWKANKSDPGSSYCPWKIYNIGNNKPVNLMNFIKLLERELGKKAKKKYLPLQPGDVKKTFANIDELKKNFGYYPKTKIEKGVKEFAIWFKNFHKK